MRITQGHFFKKMKKRHRRSTRFSFFFVSLFFFFFRKMNPEKTSSHQEINEKVPASLDEQDREKQHTEDVGFDPDAPLGIQKVYLIKKYARRVDIWIIIVG